MKREIIHTPEGVRDIYNGECKKKLFLQNKLHKVLHAYGYQDMQTPTFEFYDVFRKEIGTIPSKELYKFFDRDGNTMALRPDITPSIARVAATVLAVDVMPARLCYIGNTFINHFSYQGHLKENTQMGAELIGLGSVEADAEMIALAVDCLKKAGLKEFQINIGHVGFYESLMQDAGLNEEVEWHLRELITNRNYFGADELLEEAAVKASTREAFTCLFGLNGGAEILKDADKISPNAKAREAIRRLEEIYKILQYYQIEKYITFDLSMSGNYLYYTGIIFRGYTYGTGDAIVKGGRYDGLLEKFGKAAPSIGFAIVIDEVMSALSRQKIEIPCGYENTLIVYEPMRQEEAISLAREFREQENKAELLKKETDKTLEEYAVYGKENFAGNMIYLNDNQEIRMMNLLTGECKNAVGQEKENEEKSL